MEYERLPEDGPADPRARRSRRARGHEQLAEDDASYRAQLAYLLERSAFYREKLDRGRRASRRRRRAGSRTSPRCRSPRSASSGPRHAPEDPVGAHLCAARAEIVRIYSTSGTTGTPSYIPLTAGDLDNWVTGSARSYAASGVGAGERDSHHLQRRPVRGRRGARRLRPDRALPHPGRHRQHRAPDAGHRAAQARGGRAHAVVRGAPRGVGGRSGASTCAGRASCACSWRASPAAASRRFRAQLEEGWGARVTEAMGIGDIGVSLWGECEEQDGMHLGARGFVHPELVDPDTGDGARARGRSHRRARADAPQAPRGAATALPHARSRQRPDEPVRLRAHRARACAASGAPTTC